MDIRPILSTLLRHKTAASLIVVEIALSCAIICNALFLISTRVERMQRPSGVEESALVRVAVRSLAKNDDSAAITRADLAALRAIPGVESATTVNQVPFGNSSWNSSVNLEQNQPQPNLNAATYMGGEGAVATLGLELVDGRDFQPDEFIDWEDLSAPGSTVQIPSVILTQAVADKLFPGGDAVGKSIYSWGDGPHRVVGIVAGLAKPNEFGGPPEYHYSMLFPVRMPFDSGGFILRVSDPSQREEVIRQALKTLASTGPTRILPEDDAVTMEQLRSDYYRLDRSMAWLLVAVSVALLVVTALGIVGLASFWVQQRTKQIGVRRALGATRSQILRYFQAENFLLATVGIVLGMIFAFGINQLLMGRYELPRLPLAYLPAGAIALWLLGQIAVYGPARRASAVPPALATRTI